MTTVAAETISTGLEECESLEEIEFHQSKLTDDNIFQQYYPIFEKT